jgi:hypothetical protein
MSDKLTGRVAKAIWKVRRQQCKDLRGIELEPWGDGSIPRANHVFEEAAAAIAVVEAYGNELIDRFSITVGLPNNKKTL